MAKYVVLVTLTEQALRDMKSAPDRTKGAQALARSVGGEMIETYFTLGQYDIVGIMDFPNDAAAVKYALSIGALGNARTATMRAFTSAEFGEILGSLPD